MRKVAVKIEQQEEKFQPIVITLEARGEADLLLSILAVTSGTRENEMLYKLFNALGGNEAYSVSPYRVKGNIRFEDDRI